MSTRSTWLRGALIAPIAASALIISACGPQVGGDSNTPEAADLTDVEAATEISFWSNHPGGSKELEEELIKRFTEETGITVNLVTAGSNYEEVSQRFQTAQVTADVGDVVVVSDATWFTNYLNGSLLPLDDALKEAGADPGTYHETLYDDYLYEGAHYGAPYSRSTPLFYYNKDVYQQAGLEDRAPKNWDEVKEFSAKIAESDATATPFGFPPETQYPAWTMANMVWGWGGSWSEEWDFDPLTSDATVEALQFAQDSVNDSWATVTNGDQAVDFSAGAIAQTVASTGGMSSILEAADFEVGVGFLPAGPKSADGIVPTGGAGLAIAAKATPERQLAAAKFIDFITSAESTAFFSAGTGYLPVRTDADMGDVYDKTPQFETAVKQLEVTRSQDYARVFVPGGDLALSSMLQRILTTGAEPEAELDKVKGEIEGLYERDLKGQIDG